MYIDSWDNKVQYLWLQCQASNHPSDNQHSEMHNLFREILTVHGIELRLF